MSIAHAIEQLLIFLLVLKVLGFVWLLVTRPDELRKYPWLERLKMAIPFGFGRRFIKPEDWPALKAHHFRRQTIIYLMLLRLVLTVLLALSVRMNWMS